MLNYIFAILAVSFAVLSLALLYIGGMFDEEIRRLCHTLVFILGVLKFFLLLVITINTKEANSIDFNHRAITYRYIMEQFRCMCYLPLVGIRSTPESSASQYMSGKWKNNYIERYIQTRIKKVFLEVDDLLKDKNQEINYNYQLVSILEFIKANWLNNQIDYYRKKHARQKDINERIEKYVNYLNFSVLIAVFVDIIWGAVSYFRLIPESIDHYFHQLGTPLILISATIIPALVASYNGIRFQTEARKLSERSEIMAKLLGGNTFDANSSAQERSLLADYDQLIIKVQTQQQSNDNPGSFTSEAMDIVKKTAQLTINEVTEWTFIYSREVLDT